jgi:hypothetical protein
MLYIGYCWFYSLLRPRSRYSAGESAYISCSTVSSMAIEIYRCRTVRKWSSSRHLPERRMESANWDLGDDDEDDEWNIPVL